MAHIRLNGQMLRVFEAMKDGRPYRLAEVAKKTGDPEASVSAQMRHLRKARFGGHTVERIAEMYRLVVNYS